MLSWNATPRLVIICGSVGQTELVKLSQCWVCPVVDNWDTEICDYLARRTSFPGLPKELSAVAMQPGVSIVPARGWFTYLS